jgi:hypothetical protein
MNGCLFILWWKRWVSSRGWILVHDNENITNLLGPENAVPQTLLSLAKLQVAFSAETDFCFSSGTRMRANSNCAIWTHCTAQLLLVKGAATLCTCRQESDKYDLTAAQYFWFAHHNELSRWFAISSLPPICYLGFSFMGGVGNKVYNYTWIWKLYIFAGSHTQHCSGCSNGLHFSFKWMKTTLDGITHPITSTW